VARKPAISLRGLYTFCVAARHENFRAAADDLFITPSAVSHQIKGLEQELNLDLFERESRELRLTPSGRAFYEEVAPLLDELDEITKRYKAGRAKSRLRLSVQPFFASEYFVPRLHAFTDQHPDLDIRVSTSDESSEKHPKDADLSIRLFSSPPKPLKSHRLFPLRLLPAGSKAFRKKLRLKEKRIVSEFPLILHDSFPKAWQQWSKKTGIQIPDDSRTTRLDSMIAVVRAAEQGIGAALVPVPVADQWFNQQTIVPLFDEPLEMEFSYYLVYRPERGDDPNARLLIDWILDNLSE
jgi:LysR family glycine cleavage system transcriptional activator